MCGATTVFWVLYTFCSTGLYNGKPVMSAGSHPGSSSVWVLWARTAGVGLVSWGPQGYCPISLWSLKRLCLHNLISHHKLHLLLTTLEIRILTYEFAGRLGRVTNILLIFSIDLSLSSFILFSAVSKLLNLSAELTVSYHAVFICSDKPFLVR